MNLSKLLLATMLTVWQASAQMPPIGFVDLYGLRHVSEAQVRAALKFQEGDGAPDSEEEFRTRYTATRRALEAIPGVAQVALNLTCCEKGKVILYVGIQEKGTSSLRFRTSPRGDARLPNDVIAAGEAFEKAHHEAILKGDVIEDDSEGHALMHYPPARAIQEQFVAFASRDLALLRDVLRHSANAGHRALAAQVLGYAKNKAEVAGDLAGGMRDPDQSVRNNSTRAMWIIAKFAQRRPEQRIRVPAKPFIELLNSLVWTDRNKASLALQELSAGRDQALLKNLRDRALPALIEMSQWHAPGHAGPSFYMLGRIAGWSESEIDAAWARHDVKSVIRAARKSAAPR